MKFSEELALLAKIKAAFDEVDDLDVGGVAESPVIKFKMNGKSFTWDHNGIERTK